MAKGEVYGEREIIDLYGALSTYTAADAWQDGAESSKSTLQKGMAADFVVLGGYLEATPPNEMPDIKVHKMVVGGEMVFDYSALETNRG